MNPKWNPPDHDTKPFENLIIDNCDILETIEERTACENCCKSRKYFCYTCYIPVTPLKNLIPKIQLPVRIDIIKHCREIDGKSTAAHACILAPEHVFIHTYPNIPVFEQNEKVILIYPGKNAININDLFQRTLSKNNSTNNNCINLPISRVLIIDSTWNQSKGIFKDSRLQELQCVIIRNRISQFWRHQKGSPRWYLATVEALHQFLVELHETAWTQLNQSSQPDNNTNSSTNNLNSISSDSMSIIKGPYQGEYDNILFFFKYMYYKIHNMYDHENLLSYKRPLE